MLSRSQPVPLDRLPEVVLSEVPTVQLAKCDRHFLVRLRSHPVSREWLQQSLSRKFRSEVFHHLCDRLRAEGYTLLHEGLYYLTRKGAAALDCDPCSRRWPPAVWGGYLEFAGQGRHPIFGRPYPCGKYWLLAAPGRTAGSGTVSVKPLTGSFPFLDFRSVAVSDGGPEAAFVLAVRRLKVVAENRSLGCRILDQ